MTEIHRKSILTETVNAFGRKEWFRDASVYDMHPESGVPTLEIKVNYIPLFERKEVKEFALRFGLHERFITVDRYGKPTE